MSENPSPSTRARDSASSASPLLMSPFSARAMASPFSARTCSSGAPVPSTAGSARVYSSIAACELVVLEQRVGAREDRLGLRAIVRRDAARQEAGIDPESQREPFDRLRRRAGLATLDLGDVLLREAVAGEPGLREPCGHAELAQALAEARRAGRPRRGTRSCGARSHTPAQHAEHLTRLQSPEGDSPPKGGYLLAFPCQPANPGIT